MVHSQGLHDPSHRLSLLGQQAAHVVAYTRHLRQGRQIGMHGLYDLLPRHAPGQGAWPQRLSTDGFHGQVQQDFPLPLMCQRGQMEGKRGIGKKGKGNLTRQGYRTFTLTAPITQVVDDDSHGWLIMTRVGVRASREQGQHDRQQDQ